METLLGWCGSGDCAGVANKLLCFQYIAYGHTTAGTIVQLKDFSSSTLRILPWGTCSQCRTLWELKNWGGACSWSRSLRSLLLSVIETVDSSADHTSLETNYPSRHQWSFCTQSLGHAETDMHTLSGQDGTSSIAAARSCLDLLQKTLMGGAKISIILKAWYTSHLHLITQTWS